MFHVKHFQMLPNNWHLFLFYIKHHNVHKTFLYITVFCDNCFTWNNSVFLQQVIKLTSCESSYEKLFHVKHPQVIHSFTPHQQTNPQTLLSLQNYIVFCVLIYQFFLFAIFQISINDLSWNLQLFHVKQFAN